MKQGSKNGFAILLEYSSSFGKRGSYTKDKEILKEKMEAETLKE